MKIKEPSPTQHSNKILLGNSLSVNSADYPIFCFRHVHKDYGVEKCFKSDKAFPKQFFKKICEVSCLSWSEIKLAPKDGLGTEKINKESIKVSIPTTYTEDVDFFLSFYFNGTKGRIVGHRSGSVFHILYIDTQLKVYKHC